MRTILSEWIKLRTILSNKILVLGAFLFPFVIVTLAATFGSVADGPDSLEMAEFVMGMSVVTSMLLGVVTAIGLTSEYTHNTIRPTYAATPARPRVLMSKILVPPRSRSSWRRPPCSSRGSRAARSSTRAAGTRRSVIRRS